ncbi:MAG TPA: DoxX family protein [Candidatus Omnitrophota bacterium]|nr:DoxX family protein [Candidatus Omnitrophota bacterium]
MKDWVLVPLRLGIGIMFTMHGLQKAFGLLGGPGIQGFSGFLTKLGLTPATPLAYLVAYVELIGGLFIILGLFTKLAALLLIVVMVVAVAKVHLANGFFGPAGFEYPFVILSALITLLLSEPGKFCLFKKP